jgi:FSR family fosmidomycin resistance protein-like MFS transporter
MKDKLKILSTVSIYHAFNDGTVVVIPLLFPVLKELFNLSYTQVGLITSGGFLITLITQIIIGRISDRKNRSSLLSLGILILSGSLLLLSRSFNFFSLFLIIIILRFSTGFYHPTGIGWISKIFKKERLDWAMGMQSAAGDFGAFIAILSTLYIIENTSWYFPLYLWSIAGIICLFTGIYLTSELDLGYINNNKKHKKSFKLTLLEEKDQLKKIKMFLPGFIINGSAWGIVVTYLPLLLDERTDLSLTHIGLIISIWIGIGTIMCILYHNIQEKIGRKKVILFSYITMAMMALCLTFFTNTIILIIIMILLGISTFLSYPALFSFVSELTDEKSEGVTFSYIFTLQLGGGTGLIFLGGFTADIWGIWTPFLLLGITGIIVSLTLIYSFYKLKSKKL